jgi:hypothetical protein
VTYVDLEIVESLARILGVARLSSSGSRVGPVRVGKVTRGAAEPVRHLDLANLVLPLQDTPGHLPALPADTTKPGEEFDPGTRL